MTSAAMKRMAWRKQYMKTENETGGEENGINGISEMA